jgi:tryptophan synthase beta subunit
MSVHHALTHPVDGRFGAFGGQYVPETLMSALKELEDVWHEAKADPQFQLEMAGHRRAFIGSGGSRCRSSSCVPRSTPARERKSAARSIAST